MLQFDCIEIAIKSQGYEAKSYTESPDGKHAVLIMEKIRENKQCPICGGKGHINMLTQTTLKEMPFRTECRLELCLLHYQYQCSRCQKTFTDEVPFQYPGTRITRRAAEWIQLLLHKRMSVRSIQAITGIHWDTIRKVQKDMVDRALQERERMWKESNYHPRLLAVDEFAIHKGHSYATCVLDLETGEALWVGKGRAKADFAKFFEEMPAEFLSKVEAVAMDMNASYNLLVQEHLPHARIVYDRFHMQSQFGKDVLGTVRLAQAREHKAHAETVKKGISQDMSSEEKQKAQSLICEQKQLYSKLKRLRWPLLTSREKLSDHASENLDSLLDEHADLAVCYAMKEELCRLFSLRDHAAATEGWERWFAAASESNISPLVRFASLKYPRIEGLIAHALFPISTGKLEGFNNKVKLIKRIAFGYRDESFFFNLVKFFSGLHPFHAKT